MSVEGFVEALLAAPVGMSLLAELEHRRQNPEWSPGMPLWRARSVSGEASVLGEMSWAELHSTGLIGLVHIGTVGGFGSFV